MIELILAAVISTGLLQTTDKAPDERREPGGAVTAAIRLLEAKDYVNFVKRCMRPAELEEMTARHGTVEKTASEFAAGGRAEKLLEVLKAASTLTPVVNAAGTRADYRFEKPVGGTSRLSLAKVDGLWFLRD